MKRTIGIALILTFILSFVGCTSTELTTAEIINGAKEVEAGFVNGNLEIKADDEIIVYDSREGGIGTLTRKDVLAEFRTETEIEGIIWAVYSTEEYPDLSVVLLISGTNAKWTYYISDSE